MCCNVQHDNLGHGAFSKITFLKKNYNLQFLQDRGIGSSHELRYLCGHYYENPERSVQETTKELIRLLILSKFQIKNLIEDIITFRKNT